MKENSQLTLNASGSNFVGFLLHLIWPTFFILIAISCLNLGLGTKNCYAQAAPSPTPTSIQNQRQILALAGKAYNQGEYKAAVSNYTELLNSGINSASLHLNLGNSHFRLKNIGRAIFHFRKALEARPRDPDIRYNLQYSRALVKDKLPEQGAWSKKWSEFTSGLSQKESFVLLLLLGGLCFFLWTFNLWRPLPRLSLNLSLFCCLLALFFVVIQQNSSLIFGVVIGPQAKVYSGIGRDNVNLFTLNEGAEVNILIEGQSGWTQIQLNDRSKGWVKSEEIYQSGRRF